MKEEFLFLIMIILSTYCSAQSDSLMIRTEQTVENLFEEPDEESDNSDLYDLIQNR